MLPLFALIFPFSIERELMINRLSFIMLYGKEFFKNNHFFLKANTNKLLFMLRVFVQLGFGLLQTLLPKATCFCDRFLFSGSGEWADAAHAGSVREEKREKGERTWGAKRQKAGKMGEREWDGHKKSGWQQDAWCMVFTVQK